MFKLRASSKKRDSDVISASSGASKGSEPKGRTSSFSLSRLLPSRRRSKSRLSLDSEPSRSDASGACGSLSPSPYPSGAVASRASPPLHLSNVHQLGMSSPSISSFGKEQGEGQHLQWAKPLGRIASEDGFAETTLSDLAQKNETENKREIMLECPVCLLEKPRDNFMEISTCHHRCCSKCLKEYFRIEIMESRVNIACPECSELFHPNDIQAIVQDPVLMQKYEDFMLRRVLAMDSDTRWCPAPDCGYAVIATGRAGCPKLKCEREGCDTYFCYHCKQYWHPNQTCDAARAERSPNIRSASISYSQESGHQNEIKSCPRCGAAIVKVDDGSCNHMTCPVCEAAFCWLCMKEISDLHYLSPSGCTFWGSKPWSRKKKILWQLGMLVGAPIGITLVAGIAVPAMIVGIPVWVGRKIHYRYDKSSKRKRRLAITGGVFASVLAAPVVAGLAVGIGVPILLVYVYGVVPFSLCRSGGCGVTTTNNGGVRFEFDEDNENAAQGPYSYAGDNHSIETAPNVANPSIAPSIGDASLGMTNSLSASGSHMERAGVLRDDSDRDSSSHRAIAGNSINGSLCSATYSTQHHKLEVQADISEHTGQGEQSSMGGESYNISLNDDASTKALAGSIISPKDKDGISLCSRHFDGAANIYPQEGREEDCVSYSSSRQQQRGSSSCPTSPHLRKASPAPSEDTRSHRSKKCTRFMDQVSEIESTREGDCLSMASVLSSGSNSPSVDIVNREDEQDVGGASSVGGAAAAITQSNLSLTSTTTTSTCALTSCESLLNEGRGGASGGAVGGGLCKSVSLGNSCRVKAESTSVLLDGAEIRRCEMGGARRKSDTAFKSDHGSVDHRGLLIGCRKRGGKPGEKEHRSQPGNLSDISESEMRGMRPLHTAGCSNLLAVIDTSCENVFLDKTGQTKSRLTSASSCSSTDESTDYHHQHQQTIFGRRASSPSTHIQKSRSLSGDIREGINVAFLHLHDQELAPSPRTSVSDMQVDIVDSTALLSEVPHHSSLVVDMGLDLEEECEEEEDVCVPIPKFQGANTISSDQVNHVLKLHGATAAPSSQDDNDDIHSTVSKKDPPTVSRISIGSESAMGHSPLPDVEESLALSDVFMGDSCTPRQRARSESHTEQTTASSWATVSSAPACDLGHQAKHSKSPCLILSSSSAHKSTPSASSSSSSCHDAQ